MKKFLKILGGILLVIIVLFVINFWPQFTFNEDSMNQMESDNFTLYYQKEEAAAQDAFDLVEAEGGRILESLDLEDPEPVNIYLWDNQQAFQRYSLGNIGQLFGQPWMIGGAHGNRLSMVSPADAPLGQHDYESIKQTILHELVHAYLSQINPNLDLWANEGTAVYLAQQLADLQPSNLADYSIPSLEDLSVSNGMKFAEMGGYSYANLYVSYLVDNYGWESWRDYLYQGNYEASFGKPQSDLYQEWLTYLDTWNKNL
ncbi:hypothetical protein HZY86_07655 [Aerococcaceae bacterium DSM 111020]|nr:hypothetical protein [Aerococcaceae bacterium DSM 111020]